MIKKIVLTGGPGSGKTTVIEKIKQVYSRMGYKVIVVDETATYLINMGLKPFGDEKIDMVDFQEMVLKLQLAKEEVVSLGVLKLNLDKVLIIYDRGAIDNRAYVNEEEFINVLKRLNGNVSFNDLMDKYDLVINLVSCKDFYTLENNQARSEDVGAALKLGEATLKSWLGHKRLRIVLPKKTMEEKVKEVLNIINYNLEMPIVKRQEKFAVTLNEEELAGIIRNAIVMDITQDYLESEANIEKRLRKVLFHGSVSYFLSVYKVNLDKKLLVSEKNLNEKEYNCLLDFRDSSCKTINKRRYFFTREGKYYSLDIFADILDVGILEINVLEDEKVVLPKMFKEVKRVTDDRSFYNQEIAKGGSKKLGIYLEK